MNNQFNVFVVAVFLALSGQAVASSTWTLSTAAAASGATVSTSGTAVTVKATGWADTTNSSPRQLEQQNFTSWPGLGITNNDACGSYPCDYNETSAPEHAIDNNGRYEMALLSFTGGAVNLTGANFSYSGSDSDYTVLAYTGAAGGESLVGKTWATLSGWTLVGNYSSSSSGNKSFNNATYSSFWLIGAYNPLGGTSNSTYSGTDAFKLASVSGDLCTSGTPGCGGGNNSVPEPGSIALIGLGLLGLIRARKYARK